MTIEKLQWFFNEINRQFLSLFECLYSTSYQIEEVPTVFFKVLYYMYQIESMINFSQYNIVKSIMFPLIFLLDIQFTGNCN